MAAETLTSARRRLSRRRNSALRDARKFDAVLILMSVLALVGGASRNDLWVQTIAELSATMLALWALLTQVPSQPSQGRTAVIAAALAALGATMVLQIIPLPPVVWHMLPGRELEAAVAGASGTAAVWRPISVSPDSTLSALLGIIVPAAALITVRHTPSRRLPRVVWLIGAIGAGELLLGLGQLVTSDGALFFYPRTAGTVTGLFHNRNHFAVFLGTLPPVFVCIALAERQGRRRSMVWPACAAACMLTALGVVLTGSRIGVVVLALGIAGAALMFARSPAEKAERAPRDKGRGLWFSVAGATAFAGVCLAVLATASRETSLARLGSTDLAAEGRVHIFRSLLELAARYLPFGSGFGTFDPVYRMAEPDDALQLSYLNHAHNDLIEVVIEGGLASAAIAAAVLGFAVAAAAKAWRGREPSGAACHRARMGSIVAADLLIGSISDYPLRTPFLQAWLMLALYFLLSGSSRSPAIRQVTPEG